MIECNVSANGHALGASNPFAKYSADQVAQVRHLFGNGLTFKAIAEQVGCSKSMAFAIVKGRKRSTQKPVQVRYRFTEQDMPKVAALHQQGHTIRQIAVEMGSNYHDARHAVLHVTNTPAWKPAPL